MLKIIQRTLCLIGFLLLLPITVSHANPQYSYQSQNDTDQLQAIINPPNNASNTNTWLGADVGSSIKLTANKYIWIFGDTLLGSVSQKSRTLDTMIHNTVGTTTCNTNTASCRRIQKYDENNENNVTGIFTFPNTNQYYWPMAGSILINKLFITGNAVSTSNDTGEWIPIVGTNFILVDNPMSTPSSWQYTVYTVPHTNANLNWTSAAVKQESWLYIFGAQKASDQAITTDTVLSRITLENAEASDWTEMEYWSNKNKWEKNISSSNDLGIIPGLPGTSEMSIAYNDTFGWYTVQIPAFTFDVHFYTAKNLIGPWVDQGKIYTIPQPWNPTAGSDSTTSFFVYAAKVHPELATSENEIVLTYNINQMDTQSFINNLTEPAYWGLYVPQFATVKVNKNSLLNPQISSHARIRVYDKPSGL